MRTVDLTQRILECAKQAETAPNPQARVIWKQMENFWRERLNIPKPTMTFAHLSRTAPAPTRR